VISGAKVLVARVLESVLWGGRIRERALLWLLGKHYGSVFRRKWRLAPEPPHFFDHRIDGFALMAGEAPFPLYRGYLAAELVGAGDVALDIGCGDGYFTKRFIAPRAAHVDGIDIEPSAIGHATKLNPAVNVTYVLADAVHDPFPRGAYDVVIWDGALGHFAAEATTRMLEKIAAVLTPNGVFAGSESLGVEGHDHLQFFDTLDDLGALLSAHFKHVVVRELRYGLPGGVERREAFWRCAHESARIDAAGWRAAGRPAQTSS
jgi:SAM-dependent methyltransferase